MLDVLVQEHRDTDSRDLGFFLDHVRELLGLADERAASAPRPCADVDVLARAHLAHVEEKLARLAALKAELERVIAQCGGGRLADCRILEALADASHGRRDARGAGLSAGTE